MKKLAGTSPDTFSPPKNSSKQEIWSSQFFRDPLPSSSPHSAGYTRTSVHPYFPVAKSGVRRGLGPKGYPEGLERHLDAARQKIAARQFLPLVDLYLVAPQPVECDTISASALDRYRTPSAIGSAIGRLLSRIHRQVGVLNRLVLNRLGGLNRAIVAL